MTPDERFGTILGDWHGEEQVFATAWTSAGTTTGHLSITPGPGGIILDYVQEGAEHRLVAHGVVSGDGFWWFDSFGFVPEAAGQSGWQDDMLVLDRRSDRGRTVMGLRVGEGELHVQMATVVPADGELAPLMSGRYRRA